MIRSWSHQLLIIYILTIYVLYTKIGVLRERKTHRVLMRCVFRKYLMYKMFYVGIPALWGVKQG